MWKRSLKARVKAIERDMETRARAVADEELWITHYGAFDIHPKHLVFWLCVKTDEQKGRLAADRALMGELRDVLARRDYPEGARDLVHIGFESQETVDREADGHWWHHWK
jgi:hypothetical protein